MISLGIHTGHDRGAAIIENGKVLGAISEERLDRIKFSSSSEIPFKSIDALLNKFNISFNEVDNIGLTFAAVDIHKLKNYYLDQLCDHYHVNSCDCNLVMISHHLAHAETAYGTSNFNNSLILIADGGGDLVNGFEESESIFIGKENTISLLEQRLQSNIFHKLDRKQNHLFPFMNPSYFGQNISIGKKYEQLSQIIGFGQGQEGKTMGLAPYGNSMINFEETTLSNINFDLTFESIVDIIYEKYCKSNDTYQNFIQKQQANIAKTAQNMLEVQIINLTKYIIQKYNPQNICLGGGVFLNCVLNHKICKLLKKDNIHMHIFPASGDDGQAIGAAFAANKLLGNTQKISIPLPFLGLSYSNNDIYRYIKNIPNINYQFYDENELISIIADQIYKNKIVGILRGRSEIGPRALGHRSILANPMYKEMKDYLNHQVKHREDFRPFAPITLAEEQFSIFNLEQDSPYMLMAAQVKPQYKKLIPSVIHIDETARIQSVSKSADPFMYNLLLKYKEITGIPILLNTSFNVANEPIVESPADAINVLFKTNIDYLVLENYLISKKENSLQ